MTQEQSDLACGDVFTARRHGIVWTYTCVLTAGHAGLCQDHAGIQWIGAHRIKERDS
jgi:hypothetical protein